MQVEAAWQRGSAIASFALAFGLIGLGACSGSEDPGVTLAVRRAVENEMQGTAVAVVPIRADSSLLVTITGLGLPPRDSTGLDSIAVLAACVALGTPESREYSDVRVVVWTSDTSERRPRVPTAARLARLDQRARCPVSGSRVP